MSFFDFFSLLRHPYEDFFLKKMVRRRRHRRSSGSPLLSWILLLIIIFAAAFTLWKLFYTPEGVSEQTAIVLEEDAEIEVKVGEGTIFRKLPDVTKLWENETIHSENGGVRLVFFNGSTITLDKNTIVQLEKVRRDQKEQSSIVSLVLEKGRIWVDAKQETNPKSSFIVETPNFTVNTKGGSFSMDAYSLVVTKGMATISAGEQYTKDLDVGQELTFSEADLRNILVGGMGPQKEAISNIFRMSDWFAKNTADEETGERKREEEENILEGEPLVEPEEESPIVILTPGKNNETVTVKELPVRITGTVPFGTQTVMVNNFALSKFTPGQTDFLYLADPQLKTLYDGKNEYSIVVLMADGKRYETSITLLYNMEEAEAEEVIAEEPVVENEAEGGAEEENLIEEEDENVTGKLSVTTPTNGSVITASETVITGTAPSNAAKIVVNGYTLGKFAQGNETWTYILAERLGNRPVGDAVIKIEAMNSSGKVIDTVNLRLTLEAVQKTSPSGGNNVEMREGTLPPVESDGNNPTI